MPGSDFRPFAPFVVIGATLFMVASAITILVVYEPYEEPCRCTCASAREGQCRVQPR